MTTTNEHRDALDRVDITALQEEVARLRGENEALRAECDKEHIIACDLLMAIGDIGELAGVPFSTPNLSQETIKAVKGLQAENEALRAVAVAAEWSYPFTPACPICTGEPSRGHEADCPYTALRAAGYLAGEEVGA